MSYAYSATSAYTNSSLSFNIAHNGRNGLFTMADTLTVSGVFTCGLGANTGIEAHVRLFGINAQGTRAQLPERYGSDRLCEDGIARMEFNGTSVAAGQSRAFSCAFQWTETAYRSRINYMLGTGRGTAYLERLAAAIEDEDLNLTQQEIAIATPVRYIAVVYAFNAVTANGYASLPGTGAYDYINGGGVVNSAFYAAHPAFDVYFARPAAPTVSSYGVRDDAAVDAIAAFGGFAAGHSVPVFAAGIALDSHFPTLTAMHALTLSGAMTASLATRRATDETAMEFDLPPLAAGTVNYVYTVDDGWSSTSVSGSFTVYAYAPPAVSAFSATRYVEELTEGQTAYVADMSGERVWLDIAAQVAPVHGENAWESAITWWREDDEANADSDDLSLGAGDGQAISVTGNTAAGRGLFTETLDAGSVWKLRITFTDCLGNSGSAVATVDASGAILDLEPHGVAVGMRSTATAADPGKFEVAEDWRTDLGGDLSVGGDAALDGSLDVVGQTRLSGELSADGGIAGVTNYVSGEVLTGGKWIDGKQIYRYVRTGSTTSTGDVTLFSLPRTPGTVINYRGTIKTRWNSILLPNYSGGTSNNAYTYRMDMYVSGAGVHLCIGSSWGGGTTSYCLILEYTAQ